MCWEEDPELRPSFGQLVDVFTTLLESTQVGRGEGREGGREREGERECVCVRESVRGREEVIICTFMLTYRSTSA